MSQTIEIDDEVYGRLQEDAEPFVDTPNSVLRRLLGLDSDSATTGTVPMAAGRKAAHAAFSGSDAQAPKSPRSRSKRGAGKKKKVSATRAPAGSTLPEEAYEVPLLQALVDAGGSGPSRDIVEAVGKDLDARLTDIDRQPLTSGAIRWENRVQFVRLKLIDRGWMEKNALRGTWSISEEGRRQLEGSRT